MASTALLRDSEGSYAMVYLPHYIRPACGWTGRLVRWCVQHGTIRATAEHR